MSVDLRHRKALDRYEAAELYGLSFDTIRRAINSGALPAKRVGRRIQVDADALAKWFASLPDA